MRGDFTESCGKQGSGTPRDRGRAFLNNGVKVTCAALVVLVLLLFPAWGSGEGDTLELAGSCTALYSGRSISAFNQHAFRGIGLTGCTLSTIRIRAVPSRLRCIRVMVLTWRLRMV
jgi:hypothetical protein